MGNKSSKQNQKTKKSKHQRTVSEQDREELLKRARRRKKAVGELISTEETYVTLLTKLIVHLYDPLSNEPKIVSPSDHKALFSDVKVIHSLNSEFLNDIKKRFKDYDNNKTLFGDRLLEFTPYFKMYQQYMNNYDNSVETLTKLNNKKIFVEFCQNKKELLNNQPVQSLLILPIQRLPRYKLIISEILKNTEYQHPDRDQLEKALKLISETTILLNNKMKDFESRQEVKKIERRFSKKTQLVSPHRKFIREGFLTKLERTGKEKKCNFLLFNDILCYTSGDTNNMKLHQKMPIDRAFFIKDIVNHPGFKNCAFEIYSSVKSFIVVAATGDEKSKWMDSINEVIREQLKKPNATQQRELAAPLLVPDFFSDVCQMNDCNVKFTTFNRRHHCRYCGKLVCGKCSKYKLASKRDKNKIVKPVCVQCFNTWNSKYKAPEKGEIEKIKDEDSD